MTLTPEAGMESTEGKNKELFTAPWLLLAAVLVFGFAIVEKGLNAFGASIPLTDVFPRQLLEWAGTLLMFDIALTLRQLFELKVRE